MDKCQAIHSFSSSVIISSKSQLGGGSSETQISNPVHAWAVSDLRGTGKRRQGTGKKHRSCNRGHLWEMLVSSDGSKEASVIEVQPDMDHDDPAMLGLLPRQRWR